MSIENDELQSDEKAIIRGDCEDFVCGICRTKVGWPHQVWCDRPELTEPVCEDCGYYNERKKGCAHPVRRLKRRGKS